MLGAIFSVLGVMCCTGKVRGEAIMWGVIMTGVFMGGSSDSLVWGASTMGEMDYVSWSLSVLSVWVVSLAVLGSKTANETSLSFSFTRLNLTLLAGFFATFYVSDYMFFYVGFESCLVPIFFLILGWGYQPERAQAGIYMLFYTLLGSLPLFFLVLWLVSEGSSYMHSGGLTGWSVFFYIFLVGAFLVKFPMYGVHLWLLKAHVEAPVAGSMVLAGVMLKLGGYGLIRVLPFWVGSPELLSEVILCLSLWGGIVVSLSCLRQMDMKLLIASSSVVHMSVCIGGLLVMSEWGVKGGLLLMVGHGLCSSGLFYLANLVFLRSGSRSMSVSKGFLSLMPSMSLMWFLLVSANFGAPPTLNLLGEILLITTLVNWSWVSVGVIGAMSFFSACYSLYLFSLSQHGSYFKVKGAVQSGHNLEYLVLVAHWAPLNLIALSVFYLS
nr:TPA_asm: ND4 [Marinogammarus marinus]